MTAPPAPGPTQSRIEQSHAWLTRPWELMRECAAEFGDVFVLRMEGWQPFALFSRPDVIRDIFAADPALFLAGEGNAIMRPFLGEHSLFVLDGEAHRRERKRLHPLVRDTWSPELAATIASSTAAMAASWLQGQASGRRPEGPPVAFRLQEPLLELSLTVIFQAILGEGADPMRVALRAAITDLLKLTHTSAALHRPTPPALGRWDPGLELARIRARIDALFAVELRRRRELGAPGDGLLGQLMAAPADDALSDEELRDEVVTLIVAGHETTATAMAWSLIRVHDSPLVAERLRAELDALGADPGPDAIVACPYLHAVVLETLRMSPVIPSVSRSLAEPMVFGGFAFDAGVRISPCIYLTHHREDLYPEPDVFRPERFLERRFSPWEFLPFGGGARRCIGMGLALYEMKLVLATLMREFDFRCAHRAPLRGVRRSVTVGPSEGGRVTVARRQGAQDQS